MMRLPFVSPFGPASRGRVRRGLWSATLLLLVACGGEGPAAIDLRLVPDPNLNTEAQLAAQLGTMVFVLDSPEGLYPPGEPRTVGDLQIKNADQDPALELVAVVAPKAGRLPLVRVARGALTASRIDVRVLGTDEASGRNRAFGRLSGISFPEVGVRSYDVPFDLIPSELPLRVLDVSPRDGEYVPACQPEVLLVVFSRAVDPTSVAGQVSVSGLEGAPELSVEGPLLRVAGSVPGPAYRLQVGTGVRDLAGGGLDQQPLVAGAQAYAEDFSVTCAGPRSLPEWCVGGQTGYCPGPDGTYVCTPEGCGYPPCDDGDCGDGASCREGVCRPDCVGGLCGVR